MKNLSKKIGVGVVASSLVVGGAVSTGLVANADSVKDAQVQQTNKDEKLKEISDLSLVKFAKEKLKFKVFGYYFVDSSTDKRKMRSDIEDVAQHITGSDTGKYEQNKALVEKKLLNEKLLNGGLSEEDLKTEFDFNFKNGEEFIKHLNSKGMDAGVKKVRIGDAVTILVLKSNIKPNSDWYTDSDLDDLKKSYFDVSDVEERDYLVVLNDILNFLQQK